MNAYSSDFHFQPHTFLCYNVQQEELSKFNYYPYGLTISCVFLAITLIVYLSLPKVPATQQLCKIFIYKNHMFISFQLLNLHGKTLVCYVTSFLSAYITLAVLQFNRHSRSVVCYEVGQCGKVKKFVTISNDSITISLSAFFLLFCLIAAFCWQTMMCLDIWLTFG